MANKYYAVYRGVSSGIFTSWSDAKRMTDGFSGSVYKGFTSEFDAKRWMLKLSKSDKTNGVHIPAGVQALISSLELDNPVTFAGCQLFTDGSYDKDTERGSWAYVIVDIDGKIVKYDSGSNHSDKSGMWQVSGEIQAVLEGLRYLAKTGAKNVLVNYDLVNLQKWGDNEWKATKPDTIKYKEAIRKFREDGITITFHKVKAHSGSEYNEVCDYLAKKALGIKKYDNVGALPDGFEKIFV